MKQKQVILYSFLLLPVFLSAAPQVPNPVFDWMMQYIIFIIAGFIVLGALIALYNSLNALMEQSQRESLAAQGTSYEKPIAKQGFFKKWITGLSGIRPIEEEIDVDTGHFYDGIKELDNKLPPWWLYLFYITIIWAIGFLYIYEFSDIGQSTEEEYAEQMEIAKDQRRAYLFRTANAVNEETVTVINDEGRLESGANIYLSNCMACHGMNGEGGVGPNFTDEYWIHGGDIKDLFMTIKYGVPEKGMISWRSQLPPAAMQDVASYILSFQGTDPPNQKKPEGELYKPELE